jgi:predicted DCC family thiol-disulfide oxidoreductase YuxK
MRMFDGVALYPVTLLYDGACPVCSLEMDHLRARNTEGRLAFIDIAAPGFDVLAWGATLADMNAQIHAVRPDGTLIVGIEALRVAYRAVGLGWLLAPTGWAPLRPVFDAGYRAFARHRQTVSRLAAPLIDAVRSQRARSMAARMQACAGGRCEPARPGAGAGAGAGRFGQTEQADGSPS